MGKAPCCDKASVKKGPWSPEEDRQLKEYIDKHGTGGNWIALPNKAGLKRCGKSCRLRWLNYLRPNIKHGDFSDDEDRIICTLYASIGSRWSIIASQLPGRTDNDIKNYWNTKLKKKLLGFPPPQKNKQQQHDLYSSVASQCLQVEGGSTISPYLVDNSCSLELRVQILPASAPDQRNCSFIKFGGDQQSTSHINSADLDLLYRADQMMNCAYGGEGFNFEAFASSLCQQEECVLLQQPQL